MSLTALWSAWTCAITWVLHLFASLHSTVQSYPALYDGLTVVVAGGFFELSRRGLGHIGDVVLASLTVKARIAENDEAFDWLYLYLSNHVPISCEQSPPGTWSKGRRDDPNSHLNRDPSAYSLLTLLMDSVYPRGLAAPRDVQLSTRKPAYSKRYGAYDSEEELRKEDVGVEGRVNVLAEPGMGTLHNVQFAGRTVKMGVMAGEDYNKSFVMSMFLGTHSTFNALIQQARREYLNLNSGQTCIFVPRSRYSSTWSRLSVHPSRAWESVVLSPNVKEALLDDAKEFLDEKSFYLQRGLPYRRGYLRHGVPGSGKSSLISALAAKLKLDIYLVNLGAKDLDDHQLQAMLQTLPGRCILLMEDIDCAFKKRKSTSKPSETLPSSDSSSSDSDSGGGNDVTLSGLLNAIDGVASSEGRLLFCTTNWVSNIDPALSRPGRCDVWIEFTNATRYQAKELFLHFYRDVTGSPSGHSLIDTGVHSQTEVVDHLDLPNGDGDISGKPSSHSLEVLAESFALALPEDTLPVSALQGYLMRYKRDPVRASSDVPGWVAGGFARAPVRRLTGKQALC